MRYTHIVFDIDGTLIDTEEAILTSLQMTLKELEGRELSQDELRFALGITGMDALKRLQVKNPETFLERWVECMDQHSGTSHIFPGIQKLLDQLKGSCTLGIISSQTRDEFENSFIPYGLKDYFQITVLSEDTDQHKPDAAPALKYLEKAGIPADEMLYIGDSVYDMRCAASAGVDCALALWGCRSREPVQATWYLHSPEQVMKVQFPDQGIYGQKPWLSWAMELQFIAQAGITYTNDPYDLERFRRVREISAEIMGMKTGYSMEHVTEVFCNETGFQTPKLDTRAAIFQDDKILLVKEWDGLWALPGGWVDVNQSIRTNTIKEVKEEAGLDVQPVRLIALQDRNQHNAPLYAYGICKAFVLCEVTGGSFLPNPETSKSAYFTQDQLPPLALEKTTPEQIELCFQAYHSPEWDVPFD